ncbi:hypothetical protein GMOD_00003899 [Pyrenophora seminiperda CCB06]|uniref:Uncharacterized protein n=1 Tax=Pyrenophora seminiperda CCB06 TaxID=1302712 RepID=A0A3M7M059_9PLEO|nr:hypothetical protein GMOD_00003899 [Pyrenophora seminiperda CCB06]
MFMYLNFCIVFLLSATIPADPRRVSRFGGLLLSSSLIASERSAHIPHVGLTDARRHSACGLRFPTWYESAAGSLVSNSASASAEAEGKLRGVYGKYTHTSILPLNKPNLCPRLINVRIVESQLSTGCFSFYSLPRCFATWCLTVSYEARGFNICELYIDRSVTQSTPTFSNRSAYNPCSFSGPHLRTRWNTTSMLTNLSEYQCRQLIWRYSPLQQYSLPPRFCIVFQRSPIPWIVPTDPKGMFDGNVASGKPCATVLLFPEMPLCSSNEVTFRRAKPALIGPRNPDSTLVLILLAHTSHC